MKSELSGLIIGAMGGDPKPAEEKEEKEADPKETVAAEFLLACDKRDPALLVKAFEALFQMCELEPHEEGGTKGDRRSFESPLPGGYIDESEL